jgi:mRNA-degrading endonuclease toxin of MazEF toxin-antitoxin module
VAAISSKFESPVQPREVPLEPSGEPGLQQPVAVILNRVLSIDAERRVKRQGTLDAGTVRSVDDVLMRSLEPVEIQEVVCDQGSADVARRVFACRDHSA